MYVCVHTLLAGGGGFRYQSIGHATTPSMCQLNLICTDDGGDPSIDQQKKKRKKKKMKKTPLVFASQYWNALVAAHA